MSSRPRLRSATAPAMRGRPTTWVGKVEHAARRGVGATAPNVKPTLWGTTVVTLRTARRFVRWCWRWRECTLPLALGATLDLLYTSTLIAGIVTLAVAVPSIRKLHRNAWRSRRMFLHGRDWADICDTLTINPLPEIVDFRERRGGLELTVKLTGGHDPALFQKQRSRIAVAADASVSLAQVAPTKWAIAMRDEDLLAVDQLRTEGWPRIAHTHIPIGIDGWGDEITAPLFESRWLIAGMSGAGKSTVLNALLASFVAVHGLRIWCIDAQEGNTFRPWRHRVNGIADSVEAAADMLGDLAKASAERLRHLDPDTQQVTIDASCPLNVVVIDELSALTITLDDKLRKRCVWGLTELMQRGRKVGYPVVAALQDPRREHMPKTIQSQFSHTLALACKTGTDANVILGPGAVTAGWDASRVPDDQPGRGLWASRRTVREVRAYRMQTPLPAAVALAASPEKLAGSWLEPTIPPGYIHSDQGNALSADSDWPQPTGPVLKLVSAPDDAALRDRIAVELLRAGGGGVSTAELVELTGRPTSTVKYHLDRLGAETRRARWYHPDHRPKGGAA